MNAPNPARAVPVAVPTVTSSDTIAHLVRIRAIPGAPTDAEAGALTLTGLPEMAGQATRDRLHAAIANAGLRWPGYAIELSVFPHPLPAGDSGLDAAFAVALLAATDQVPRHMLTGLAVIGEVGLGGSLHPVPDVAQRLTVAARAGIGHAIIPAAHHTRTVAGLAVHTVVHLRHIAELLRSWPAPHAWPHR
jgi:magnesium chelatase family protein